MAFGVSIIIEGDDIVEKALKDLPDRIFNQVMKAAVSAAMIPVVDSAKSKCPMDTGLLKESIGCRIKSYKRSGTMVGVVGPRSGFKKLVQVFDQFGNAKTVYRNPTKYAHLVEFGTRSHSLGKSGVTVSGVNPRPFLRPAYDENKDKSVRRMRSAIFDGVALYWDKLNKQAARKRKVG